MTRPTADNVYYKMTAAIGILVVLISVAVGCFMAGESYGREQEAAEWRELTDRAVDQAEQSYQTARRCVELLTKR